MKTFFLFAIIGFALRCGVVYADPPGNRPAPKDQTHTHLVPLEPVKPPLKDTPRPASGAAVIGGPANLRKANPVITGAVNPAKDTVVISGTGMKHKP